MCVCVYIYIYAGVTLDARISEVQPVSRAATPIATDRTPKFRKARFAANSSASFSGQTVTFWRQPPTPQGRSCRSLHRSVLLFLNPSLFDCFPFVFLFPVDFPASSSMASPLLRVLRPSRACSRPRAPPPDRAPPRALALRATAGSRPGP